MGKFALYLGGPVTPTKRLRDQIAGRTCIAADGGIRHADIFGSKVALWVGDFDSSDEPLKERFAQVPQSQHPSDKAFTDGELAAKAALEMGASNLLFIGGIGGRYDHSHAVLTQAMSLAATGSEVVVTNGTEEATPLGSAPRSFDYPIGTVFSILAFSDLAGLALSGARWPLHDADVSFGDTLTISNEVAGGLTATLKSGRAVLLAQLGGH